tara:strand:- start:147 stop:359 length:213 start_codon:yes stop_codon:yes gene_type:complete
MLKAPICARDGTFRYFVYSNHVCAAGQADVVHPLPHRGVAYTQITPKGRNGYVFFYKILMQCHVYAFQSL